MLELKFCHDIPLLYWLFVKRFRISLRFLNIFVDTVVFIDLADLLIKSIRCYMAEK